LASKAILAQYLGQFRRYVLIEVHPDEQ
jgi:hypothetical protein